MMIVTTYFHRRSHKSGKCSSSRLSPAWLAGVAAGARDKARLVARNAHRLEALHALAAGRGTRGWLGSIGAWALHGRVTVQGNCLVISEASWAALAGQALQHKGWDTLDVCAPRHQAASL